MESIGTGVSPGSEDDGLIKTIGTAAGGLVDKLGEPKSNDCTAVTDLDNLGETADTSPTKSDKAADTTCGVENI